MKKLRSRIALMLGLMTIQDEIIRDHVDSIVSHSKMLDRIFNRLAALERTGSRPLVSMEHVEALESRIFMLENPPVYGYGDDVIAYLSLPLVSLPITRKYVVGKVLKYVGCRNMNSVLPAERQTLHNMYSVESGGEVYTVREKDMIPFSTKAWEECQKKSQEREAPI